MTSAKCVAVCLFVHVTVTVFQPVVSLRMNIILDGYTTLTAAINIAHVDITGRNRFCVLSPAGINV